VEFKTRTRKSFKWGDAYPQLYLSQTPHIIVAVHRNGTFQNIRKDKLGEGRLKRIHTNQEMNFRRLRILLGIIIKLVKEIGADKRMVLLCQRGVLKLHENLEGRSCLPDDHLALFSQLRARL
jgi:hypothetical protein